MLTEILDFTLYSEEFRFGDLKKPTRVVAVQLVGM